MSIRVAHNPVVRLASTITVAENTTTGGTVNQLLLGGSHDFEFGDNTARTLADGVVKVRRTDKFLTCTPMKVGAPDATRPTLGYSGSYSYDWQVVDRFLDECIEDGTMPYISLDACPQLLGGSVAPYTGTPLATWKPSGSAFPTEVPNDFAAFAVMCVDVVHHCTVTKGVSIPYWGLWNEPAVNNEFWGGTAAQYFALYAQVATAIKAFNPALKVGGPEDALGVGPNFNGWVKGLMSYCLTNNVPLDFVSHHDYSATGRMYAMFVAYLERAKTEIGWTAPLEIMNGEWAAATQGNFPQGKQPLGPAWLTINDYGAATTALSLMEMQRLGYVLSSFTSAFCDLGGDNYGASGLFNRSGPWATGNVWRLWDRIGAATIVSTTLAADPGIPAMAAKRAGTLYVLIVSRHWPRGKEFPVTVALPDTANGRVTTLTVIDKDHSNQYDAGLPNAELQTVPVPDVAGGVVNLSVQGRSVSLLEIAP